GDPVDSHHAAPARERRAHRVRLVAPDERDGADRRPPDRDRPWTADRRHERRRLRRARFEGHRACAHADARKARRRRRAPRRHRRAHGRRLPRGERAQGRSGRRGRRRCVCRAARARAAPGVARRSVHGHHTRRARVRARGDGGGSGMTAATLSRATVGDGGVTQARVVRSEWTKLWSVRATRWSLLVATVLTIGFPILASSIISSHWGSRSPHDRLHFNPLDPALIGSQIAQLAIGVLGVLVISSEYSTGMIRATLTAVPKRLPVLWAKAGVFAVVTFALMLPSVLIAL